ncbi:MAG TPA: hypothetical protein PLO23_01695 [Alphaproteobacteria bacterium]|nr:hypothetical protein [Alphaproteobacteria bacterium]
MFRVNGVVHRNSPTKLEDSSSVKSALTALDYYDDSETGLSPYGDDDLFIAIGDFQKDNDLEQDGIIKPDGPTQNKINEKFSENEKAGSAFSIFVKNRNDMVEANTIGADEYFHCKANYEATQLGWGSEVEAQALSLGREAYGLIKGDGLKDASKDMKANAYGRESAKSGVYSSSSEACAIYRPAGLNEKY